MRKDPKKMQCANQKVYVIHILSHICVSEEPKAPRVKNKWHSVNTVRLKTTTWSLYVQCVGKKIMYKYLELSKPSKEKCNSWMWVCCIHNIGDKCWSVDNINKFLLYRALSFIYSRIDVLPLNTYCYVIDKMLKVINTRLEY